MGVVINQSIKNTIITYLGFGLGAINTLFLFTRFLSDEYFGLITFILSTANILMPLMAFGVNNTIIKFYSTFKTRHTQNSFLTLILFLPLVVIIPFGTIGYLAFDFISNWIANDNELVKEYVWLIYIAAIVFAYFEVYYSWAKVQMQSVFGNFMKEVFHRLGTMVLLFLLYLDIVSVDQLIILIVLVYVIRTCIMMIYAFSIKRPVIKFSKLTNVSDILKYTSLIIIAGSVANIILEIDKFMIGFYNILENVAYYSVAIYIASVVGVPSRSMHQITNPLTAKYLNEKNKEGLEDLYKKSSLNLLIISGFIFLLIILNINELYKLIPEQFGSGILVVFLIGIAKLFDNLLGNNNAILFNSDYYRIVLIQGMFLALISVLLNIYFIPLYGLNGAAYATFISVFLYNTIKISFVYRKFKMLPFSENTLKVFGLITITALIFYFWDFPFHPVVNIGLKSIIIGLLYGGICYIFNLSEDITTILNNILKQFVK
ncbi:polysaccharide biosynthesis protein [Formosa agariphila KMM 3901]|uniref:Polysaccharide biosynthesis protein n=1 Tax=Formosa agariphila (strain DSM 15362 / KCTC 12365 / LMG 23005 / KMM 3901 / M-2Alg 35-1) TaxID=1347342 RepID=T2KL23_FORAG|nr:oligosaccharide flippase family protein [Formosa agariphila]CDF79136.1 polysaccharide biosynthesis protein [Formosa agariphila KMM 3901]